MSMRTTRPAPMFMWPTSLLPICPSGKPTAGPDVLISVFGNLQRSSSYAGLRARAMALPSVSARYPQPSRTVSTIGFGRFVISKKNTWLLRALSHEFGCFVTNGGLVFRARVFQNLFRHRIRQVLAKFHVCNRSGKLLVVGRPVTDDSSQALKVVAHRKMIRAVPEGIRKAGSKFAGRMKGLVLSLFIRECQDDSFLVFATGRRHDSSFRKSDRKRRGRVEINFARQLFIALCRLGQLLPELNRFVVIGSLLALGYIGRELGCFLIAPQFVKNARA